jgi:hypothetical protein
VGVLPWPGATLALPRARALGATPHGLGRKPIDHCYAPAPAGNLSTTRPEGLTRDRRPDDLSPRPMARPGRRSASRQGKGLRTQPRIRHDTKVAQSALTRDGRWRPRLAHLGERWDSQIWRPSPATVRKAARCPLPDRRTRPVQRCQVGQTPGRQPTPHGRACACREGLPAAWRRLSPSGGADATCQLPRGPSSAGHLKTDGRPADRWRQRARYRHRLRGPRE